MGRSAADIGATCYTACEAQTSSNLEYKACLARAADAADANWELPQRRLICAFTLELLEQTEIGIEYAQGHYVGAPQSVDTLEALLASDRDGLRQRA